MNTRHLDTLVWVVRLGGIGAAARHLNVTQPTVTRRIQELERNLGTCLFRREGGRFVTTGAARLCASNAERILGELTAMRVATSGPSAIRATVRVGVGELVALTWLHRLLERMEQTYPNVLVNLDVDLSSRLLDKLARRDLDFVIVPGPVAIPHAVKADIGSCSFRWLASPLRFRTDDGATPHKLAELPIITLPHEADLNDTMMRWFEASGARPARLSVCNSFSVVTALVRKGLGVSLMPVDYFAEDLSLGSLIALGSDADAPLPRYSTAYLDAAELPILAHLAAMSLEESRFRR